jgi:hypothetical protein
MNSQLKRGQEVNLVSYGGNVIRRTVVDCGNGVVFVCKSEEFRCSEDEKREPVCIGFKIEDIVAA